ncbi:hypothetical protein BH09VER1_BH09VER1_32390 [soil metagenome]
MVVIAILGVLVALLMTATGNVVKKADQAAAVANYRQIGTAIALYAADQNSTMPGPLAMSQTAYYDPTNTQQLVTRLGNYLGVKDPLVAQKVAVFVPPSYRRDANVLPFEQAGLFLVNNGIVSNGQTLVPFGEAIAPQTAPMKILAVPTGVWLLCDSDQLHPRVVGQRWASKTPAKPLHSPSRLALFVDGRVDFVSNDALKPAPRSGPPGGGPPGGGPPGGGPPH